MKAFLFIFLLFLFSPPSIAKCLRIASTGDYAPFSILQNGHFIGFDIDLIKIVAKKLNKTICWKKTSWPTLSDDLQSGKYDLAISGISITSMRKYIGYFSLPYYQTGKTALFRCEDKSNFKTLHDLNKSTYTVVFNPGGTNEQYVKQNLKNTKRLKHYDNISIPKILLYNKADFFITDKIEAKVLAVKYSQRLCYNTTNLPNSQQQLAIFIAQKKLQLQIDKIILELKQNKILDKLLSKYQL